MSALELPALSYDFAAPRELLRPSQWVDQHVVLPPTSPKAGKMRVAYTPFWAEPLDAFVDPDCQEVVVMASAQAGKTLVICGILGYFVDRRTVDIMLAVAGEKESRHLRRTRILPMLLTPEMQHVLTGAGHDLEGDRTQLATCSIFYGWANSAASLASKTCGMVLLDEVSKWPETINREGSPVDLARQRTNAFGRRRKIGVFSSPTTPVHGISLEYERTDRRQWKVPCPACGHWQAFVWSYVRWPKDATPDELVIEDLVEYQCSNGDCEARWTEKQRMGIVRAGQWVPDGCEIVDGQVVGASRVVARGYHVHGLMSPFRTMSDFATRFLRAGKDRHKLGVFFRSDLGEPWRDGLDATQETKVPEPEEGWSCGEVPDDVAFLVGGVDVAKRVCHYVVLGVRPGLESWLVECGTVASLAEFEESILPKTWEGHEGPVRRCAIDSGYRPADTYDLASRHRQQVVPVRGSSNRHQGRLWSTRALETTKAGKGTQRYRGLRLFSLDVHALKDLVAQLCSEGRLHVPLDVPADYIRHLESEVQVERDDGKVVWEPRYKGSDAHNHFLDATGYALGVAWIAGLWRTETRKQGDPSKIRKTYPGQGEERPGFVPGQSAPPPLAELQRRAGFNIGGRGGGRGNAQRRRGLYGR